MKKEYKDRDIKPIVNPPVTLGDYEKAKKLEHDAIDRLLMGLSIGGKYGATIADKTGARVK